MLNLPLKILKTVEITAENIEITIDDIDQLVAAWDAWAKVTSRHLVIIWNARTIDVSDFYTTFLRFNGSVANDYNYQRLSGVAAAPDAGRTEGANAIVAIALRLSHLWELIATLFSCWPSKQIICLCLSVLA